MQISNGWSKSCFQCVALVNYDLWQKTLCNIRSQLTDIGKKQNRKMQWKHFKPIEKPCIAQQSNFFSCSVPTTKFDYWKTIDIILCHVNSFKHVMHMSNKHAPYHACLKIHIHWTMLARPSSLLCFLTQWLQMCNVWSLMLYDTTCINSQIGDKVEATFPVNKVNRDRKHKRLNKGKQNIGRFYKMKNKQWYYHK